MATKSMAPVQVQGPLLLEKFLELFSEFSHFALSERHFEWRIWHETDHLISKPVICIGCQHHTLGLLDWTLLKTACPHNLI